MKIIGIIPARYTSSRFPGKPLSDICGKPMVWWVYNQSIKVKEFDSVYVATDDERIYNVCKDFSMNVFMTSSKHRNGTERVAEVASKIDADIFVNIQGDEPLIEPEVIHSVICPLLKESSYSISNIVSKIENPIDVLNPTVVKVAKNIINEIIYFSRQAVPYPKNSLDVNYYRHLGLYGFKKDVLLQYPNFKQGILEQAEDIEMLRFLENGYKIISAEVVTNSIGVDTPKDLEKVVKIVNEYKIT
jgi:3-deoxy-manno-octulosonate cytidylyltransferase (CMP-KDO synthetase)